MNRNLHITGSREPRPAARRVAYCDGGIDAAHRDGIDVELSHWIPNRTPREFKASTSTEICLNYAAFGALDAIDLVVNNHVDTDGMLSTFALLQPELALAHRDTLVQAAGMGDFGGWGDDAAQRLWQLMALARTRLEAERADALDIYRHVHALVQRALGGERFGEVDAGIAALAAAVERVERDDIARRVLGSRLVQYVLDEPDLPDRAWLTRLDEPLAAADRLPSAARARLDAERLQIVSARRGGGWVHDVCVPGYAWAETVGLWRPPGLTSDAGSNAYRVRHAPLDAAAAALNAREKARGRWTVATSLTPFEALGARRFPVVLSFVDGDRVAASALAPGLVGDTLAAQAIA